MARMGSNTPLNSGVVTISRGLSKLWGLPVFFMCALLVRAVGKKKAGVFIDEKPMYNIHRVRVNDNMPD